MKMIEQRFGSIDYGKFVFSILIIGLHTAVFSDISYDIAFFINQILARLAVPFFFISSGFFIGLKMLKNNNDSSFIYKYFLKYLKLFLFFSLLYSPLTFYWAYSSAESLTVNILQYIQSILFLAPAYLWFIIALALGVVIVKFLVKIPIILGVFISLILFFTGVLGNSYLFLFDTNNSILNFYFQIFLTTRNGFFFSVPYIYSGYLVAIYLKNIKIKTIFAIFIFSFLLYSIEVYFVHSQLIETNIDTSMYFLLLPTSLFLFILIKMINIKNNNTSRELARMSLYLYVFQFAFISFVLILNKYVLNHTFIITPTLAFFFTLFGSGFLYLIYRRLNFRRIIK
jgi:hypothetical protein